MSVRIPAESECVEPSGSNQRLTPHNRYGFIPNLDATVAALQIKADAECLKVRLEPRYLVRKVSSKAYCETIC